MLFSNIGVLGRDQPLDQRLHLLDVFGGARLDGWRQATERRHVLPEILVGLFRQITDGNATLGRSRIDLVVDIRDIANVRDVDLAIDMPQQAEQHIEYDDRARIADMGEVVDRRSAHIHTYACRIDRREHPLLARQRIVELEFHSK